MQRLPSRWRWWLAGILTAATVYATVRYHVAQPEPWSRFFFWTANKAVSFAAAGLLAASYLHVPNHRHTARALGLCGFILAFVHSLLSWPLLGPANYPKFYSAGALNDAGIGSVVSGILAMSFLFAPALTSLRSSREALGPARWASFQRLGYAALALTAFHVFSYGYKGWLQPAAWPAALPPITLLSFLLAVAPVLRWLFKSKGNSDA